MFIQNEDDLETEGKLMYAKRLGDDTIRFLFYVTGKSATVARYLVTSVNGYSWYVKIYVLKQNSDVA